MTTDKSDIKNIFSIFHDGSITDFQNNGQFCSLKIECMYLAERVAKDFLYFTVDIHGLRDLSLKTWPLNTDQKPYTMTDPKQIFQADLDIFDSDIVDGKIKIRVGQESNKSLDYAGGDLIFNCDAIEIRTPDMKSFDYQDLVLVCKKYWDDFAKRT